MTNAITDEAVELAVRLGVRELAARWGDDPNELICTGVADDVRAAIEAALPAIREAVGREYAGLVGKWREDADREANDTAYLLRDGVAEKAGIAIGIERCADELAALTEQENRNDQERSHDGG